MEQILDLSDGPTTGDNTVDEGRQEKNIYCRAISLGNTIKKLIKTIIGEFRDLTINLIADVYSIIYKLVPTVNVSEYNVVKEKEEI